MSMASIEQSELWAALLLAIVERRLAISARMGDEAVLVDGCWHITDNASPALRERSISAQRAVDVAWFALREEIERRMNAYALSPPSDADIAWAMSTLPDGEDAA